MLDKYVESRPWGSFECFVKGKPCTVKLLHVKPGESLSLQRHGQRDEFWRVLRGPLKVRIDQRVVIAQQGDEFFITRKTVHQAQGLKGPATILEISFGVFDEADIERLEDKYGRVSR